ncbi:MAG: polysaccharide deacetylase family protein [Kiritimatiellae bacterium]|jgi:predicted deacetylase|nr:polysaccharide deacetylase family protein [Kiritimatiellia bacterium]
MKINVSLHDVHPKNFELYDKYIKKLAGLGISKTSILAVPNWHNQYKIEDYPKFGKWLQNMQADGYEIVLHSLFHIEERVTREKQSLKDYLTANFYTAGEGEFFRITYDDAKNRVEQGLSALKNFDISPVGFVAPAWLMNANAIQALTDLGFSYTTTFHGIKNIKDDSFIKAPVIVYSSRSPWRRVVSCIWEPLWTRINRNKPVVRVALHPCDLEFKKTETSITKQIIFLAKNREILTYSEIINS